MKVHLLANMLCWLGLALTSAGCAQMPWDKKADPAGLPGAPKVGATNANSSSKTDDKALKNPLALARLCEHRGEFEQAQRLYQEIIKKTPNNPVAYQRLGIMYARRGKFKEAEENFRHALALTPDDPELLCDAGYFYYLASQPQEAERCLRRAVEIEPSNGRYCNNLALVLGEQRRDDECISLFRRGLTPTQANANYAYVLAQRGDYQRAMQYYDKALSDDHSMRVAADALVELSQRNDPRTNLPATPAPQGQPMMAAVAMPPAYANPGYAGPPAMPQNALPYAGPVANGPMMPAYAAVPPANAVPPGMQNWPAPQAYGYPQGETPQAPCFAANTAPAAYIGPAGFSGPAGFNAPAGVSAPPNWAQGPAVAARPNFGPFAGPQPMNVPATTAPANLASYDAPAPSNWTPAPVITPHNALGPYPGAPGPLVPPDYAPLMAQPAAPQYR